MELDVNGHTTYCYTGGKTFDAARPTVVFIHGVLNDHSVWILQTRWFANHGYNVLAPDLPGHGRSEGEPPATVEAGAQFVFDLLDAAGVKAAALVGHSFGSLIAVEAAGSLPERVTHLAMVGTASPMKVSPALLDASLNQPMKAIDMVNTFSHSMLAPPPSALGPGTWVYGGSKALMKRVLASNTRVNIFHTGFKACDSYTGGEAAMGRSTCAVLFILGQDDMMTMPRMAQPLVEKAGARGKVVLLRSGHQLMNEAPDGVLFALRDFIKG
ncbi:MAG: alpha/beta hydrolase [Comamonadaceae bacterium]|nr:MAG: alpha/beta hydrolase [Comamonadaceae bacterium]